jgi:hypothetical protein
MDRLTFRKRLLKNFGATDSEVAELLTYNTNIFDHSALEAGLSLPFEDELFVPFWEDYAKEARSIGVFEALKKRLIQLNFPIEAGISEIKDYKQAVRRGIWDEKIIQDKGLTLTYPEKLQLIIHQTPAGKIPICIAYEREDFVSLLQALTLKNEPKPVPNSQGAAMIAGYNNWDRIRRLKKQVKQKHGEWFTEAVWLEEFKKIIPQKNLYQDKFILLSREYYSSVPPEQVGLTEEEWRAKSLIIRCEHESTHYFTKRILFSMQNNLLDELIADCAGITAALGYFNADWFLAFVGLEQYPAYRKGGRLQNYRGVPPLSDGAFTILQRLVYHAAKNLEIWTQTHQETHLPGMPLSQLILALTRVTLEELAHKESIQHIGELMNFQP